MTSVRRATAAAGALLAAAAMAAAPLAAQLDPAARWRTLETEHFRVHFTAELEPQARRAAAEAERAWAALAAELRPPRGPVELVVADNVDFANGYATTFPSNRIVVYAQPPLDSPTLRYYGDWTALLVTHELAHVFHLDRSRGWWRVAQRVFGRAPGLFPNQYLPAWITEGLAVHYESRVTGFGRLAGSPHRAIARAAAARGRLPALGDLSLATPEFPLGDAAYAFGSLAVDDLARRGGPGSLGRYVERTSGAPVPFLLDRAARRSFGVTFTSAWRAWRDSAATADRPAAAGWATIGGPALVLRYPRWLDADTLAWGANPGRDVAGAYVAAAAGGAVRRVGRRNGVSPNVPLPDGRLVYAQLEYHGPYAVRGDLWAQRPGGAERRLTRGARLAHPDARRGDGALVAVQTVGPTTRLVRVDGMGRVTPLAAAAADTQWAEPRWSPDGARIAAVRWVRGGRSDIVVLDTLGALESVVAGGVSIESAPAWTPAGDALVYASDRDGSTQLYSAPLRPAGAPAARPTPLSVSVGGLFWPDVSRDGRVAAVELRGDGWRVGSFAPAPGVVPADSTTERAAPATPQIATADGAARAYAPWRTLAPRYWLPTIASSAAGTHVLGATTSGEDAVGRHAFAADLSLAPRRPGEPGGGIAYGYAGLGQPRLDAAASERWDHFAIARDGRRVGLLAERTALASVAATLLRPGVRAGGSLSLGLEAERRAYAAESSGGHSGSLRPLATVREGGLVASAAWTAVERPVVSVSPEDGFAAAATVRRRWREGGGAGESVSGSLRLYRGFELGGPAHQVLALRVAGAVSRGVAVDAHAVGGVGGGSLSLLPGVAIGDGPRQFGVRGFAPGARRGTRAVGASTEWRFAIAQPARGVGLLPLFVSRLSGTLFGEGGAAWCPPSATGRAGCAPGADRRTIASAGAELGTDAGIGYDLLYRLRAGVAVPVAGTPPGRHGVWTRAVGYGAVGLPF